MKLLVIPTIINTVVFMVVMPLVMSTNVIVNYDIAPKQAFQSCADLTVLLFVRKTRLMFVLPNKKGYQNRYP